MPNVIESLLIFYFRPSVHRVPLDPMVLLVLRVLL